MIISNVSSGLGCLSQADVLTPRQTTQTSLPYKIKFEVLSYDYGVAPAGAYLRIGPPFIYR